MKKQSFYTDDFYKDPQLTLDAFNELLKKNHVTEKEMYESGTFFFMDVRENEETKKILSSVISDLEAYKQYNKENYTGAPTTEIGLCAIHDDHTSAFKWEDGDKEIKWDADAEEFAFNENM